MSAAFIVDASVAMTWLFKEETTPQSAALLARLDVETALVPALWYIELANVMALAEKRRRITPADTTAFISDLSQLAIEVDVNSTSRAFTELLPLCRDHGLTAYDAVYLDLALRRRLPLATLDLDLRKAARKLDVKLLGR
jgi:predicted nucleic acid-binding protein